MVLIHDYQKRRLWRNEWTDAAHGAADGVHGITRVGGEELRRVNVHDVVRERRQRLECHEQYQPQPRVAWT